GSPSGGRLHEVHQFGGKVRVIPPQLFGESDAAGGIVSGRGRRRAIRRIVSDSPCSNEQTAQHHTARSVHIDAPDRFTVIVTGLGQNAATKLFHLAVRWPLFAVRNEQRSASLQLRGRFLHWRDKPEVGAGAAQAGALEEFSVPRRGAADEAIEVADDEVAG